MLTILDGLTSTTYNPQVGALQDYLPDVSNGEQLTSAHSIFSPKNLHGTDTTRLKEVPKFNTSNITNFYIMFYNCTYLTSIPHIDTSKGTNFRGLFNGCSSLTGIPCLNTSKGIDIYEMFRYCISLTDVPQIVPSKRKYFCSMFA